MNKLLQFVITHGSLNLATLSDLLSMLDAQIAERFVLAVFGLEDYKYPTDCPKVAKKDDRVYTMESYNYLKDEVKATYPYKEKRYYPDAEKAAKKSWDYSCKSKEGYEYEVVTDQTSYSYFTLQEWMNLTKYKRNN